MIFSRGLPLFPLGSVQDRIQREMIFRERQEKLAHLQAALRVVGTIFNLDVSRVFGSIQRDYALEVFQEMYDATLLEEKVQALRLAQAVVAVRRQERDEMMGRLDRMGNVKVGKFGSDYDQPPSRR